MADYDFAIELPGRTCSYQSMRVGSRVDDIAVHESCGGEYHRQSIARTLFSCDRSRPSATTKDERE